MNPISAKWYMAFQALAFLCLPALGETEIIVENNATVSEIGIPVRSVNWVQLHAGVTADDSACIYAVMGQESQPLFVLQIDPRDGSLRQFDATVPKANFPTATLMSRTGKLYIGSSYAGHLLRFNPEADELEDLGAIHPEAAIFPCRIDEGADGTIWIGSYGTADLTSFDPTTGEFTHHGRMDEVDMYNYPLVNTDGTVANNVRVTRSFVVVLDPDTGRREQVGPIVPKNEGTLNLYRGIDGVLYIQSTAGNFRLEGFEAIPVEAPPNPMQQPVLPDGTRFSFADASSQSYRQLQLNRPTGEVDLFELGYEASGSRLFYVHEGPDGLIYGSSILPLHFFRYDPSTGQVEDLGQCSTATGEAYSMANLDGDLYIASYPQAVLSVYDPARPYSFGSDADSNPRDLGRIDDLSFRPRSTLTGPLGRVWTASLPDYGRWSGPLSWFDPATGERHAYHGVAGEGSCYTLAWLEELGLIAVGTTIDGGSGTQPRATEASLFLWDYERQEKIWEGGFGDDDDPARTVNSLIVVDGDLYGTIRREHRDELFHFDPVTRTIIETHELANHPLDLGLVSSTDGAVYGFTLKSFYQMTTSPLGLRVLVREEEESFLVAGPIIDLPDGRRQALFARNHRLMAIDLR